MPPTFTQWAAQIRAIDPRRQIEAAARDGAAAALGQTVALVTNRRVMVRTGALLRSIDARALPTGFEVRAGVPYASFLEDGTAKIRARRFLADGLAAGIDAARKRLGLSLFEVRR